jgi:NAD binding domain of 6-phosphogluconate dehydrogenase
MPTAGPSPAKTLLAPANSKGSAMTRTGFIGLGGMGRAMAANILAAGWPVTVFNRTPGREEGLPREHLRVATSPFEAAHDAEIVVTMLADDAAVEAATFGPNGLLSGLAENAVHVSMSTISVACSRRLAAAHGERGREEGRVIPIGQQHPRPLDAARRLRPRSRDRHQPRQIIVANHQLYNPPRRRPITNSTTRRGAAMTPSVASAPHDLTKSCGHPGIPHK